MSVTTKEISARLLHEFANVHNIATSDFRTSSLQEIRKELALDTGASALVDHDSSIFSPAAYFVDLMRLKEKARWTAGSGQFPTALKLDARRPDLWKIRLDADNTTTKVPFLSIVNEAMAAALAALAGAPASPEATAMQLASAAEQIPASAQYSLNLPYNEPLHKIRAYLQHFETDLATVFEAFGFNDIDVAREHLRLSREELDLITMDANEVPSGDAKTLLSQAAGLTPERLRELEETKFLSGARFVFSSAHRFIRLANKLEWSFGALGGTTVSREPTDGALAAVDANDLNEAAIVGLAKVVGLNTKHDLPIEQLIRLWGGNAYGQADSRLGILARVLKVSTNEALLLIDLVLNARQIKDVDDFRNVADCALWLKEAALSVDQLQYIITGAISPYINPGYAPAGIAPMLEELTARMLKEGGAQGSSQAVTVPTGTATSTLGRVADEIVEALAGFFNADAGVMRALLAHSVQVAPTADVTGHFLSPPQIPDASLVTTLARSLFVARTFGLTASEVAGLAHIIGSKIEPQSQFTLSDLQNIHAFKALAAAFHDTADGLLKYLKDPAVDNLAATSGWSREQLQNLQALDRSPVKPTVQGVAALKRLFDLAGVMSVGVASAATTADSAPATTPTPFTLQKLIALHHAVGDPGELARNAQVISDQLHDTVQAKHPDAAEWDKVEGAMIDAFNARKRDALAALLLHNLTQAADQTIADNFNGMTTLKDLSDYLLVDVEMSGGARISRIKAGLNTLQLYLQRCRTGLEGKGSVTFPIADEEWAQRSHYRLWEANRKVFLYPENYLDPALRKQQTPLFKELQDELRQGDITDATVTKAYINYFDKLDILANLKIVDMCAAYVTHPGAPDGEETLFFIGRTKNDPPVYYCRSAVVDSRDKSHITAWRPWQKIDLTIHVDNVVCIYANNRLYVVWAEQTTTNNRDEADKRITTTTATVKYSYHNVGGRWVPPQVVSELANVAIEADHPPCPFPPGRPVAVLTLSKKSLDSATSKAWVSFRCPPGATLRVPARPASVSGFKLLDDACPWAWEAVRWEPMNVGGVSALAVSADGAFLFAGTHDGVFRSADNGATWVAVSDGLESRSVAVFTVAPELVYAGMTDGRIYLTWRNQGAWCSWGRVRDKDATGSAITALATIMVHAEPAPQFVLFGTSGGIFRQERLTGTQPTELDVSSALPAGHRSVPALMPRRVRLLKGDLPNVTAEDQLSIYAATSGGVFCSADSGLTWFAAGLENKLVTTLALSADLKSIFAGTPSGVFRSGDGGATWMPYGLESHFVSHLAVSGQVLVAATHGSVFRCADTGDTWVTMTQGLENKPVAALTPSPDGRFLFACSGEANGLFRAQLQPDWFYVVMAAANGGTNTLLGIANGSEVRRWYRLTSSAVHELRENLMTGGLDTLRSLDSQSAREFPVHGSDSVSDTLDFNLSSSFATYYREIFFHIPFLIADTLNSNQRFEDAQQWYHHIFDPTAHDALVPHPYWRYLPFKNYSPESLDQILRDPAELALYASDRFDPHAIAALRLGAYEKAIVMKYIDNLLDWGDALFAKDNWEAIVHATMLYVLAQDLLGKKPAPTGRPYAADPVKNYGELDDPATVHNFADPFEVTDKNYFPVAANANFTGYWDRVEDRLFKIRHSMNIAGALRHLALFQPPIDPRRLIRAMTGGQDLASVDNELSGQVPHYRFVTMIQQAKNVTSTLIQLGAALLGALEKNDAEQLNLLRSTHEKALLDLTTRVKERRVEDAGTTLDALHASLAAANSRKTHYQRLSAHGLLPEEIASADLMFAALAMHYESTAIHSVSVGMHLLPNIFGLADGGSQYGQAVEAGARVFDSIAAARNQGSQLAAITAQNVRRQEEWDLQCTLAGHDVLQISAQIAGATIIQAIARADLDLHQKSIEQADEIDDFLRRRFTSQEIYQWMVRRISVVYFQTYKLALDLARQAESAYQYERNTDGTIIAGGYWDGLKKGLLAGEGLMLGLMQLEKAYMDDDARTLEIEKTISLRQLDPDALEAFLKVSPAQGTCSFRLKERLFDQDYPGHYCRKIKSVAITIPAIVGPYQNVQATLTQTTNSVLLTPDPGGVRYLLFPQTGPQAQPPSVRCDWRPQQQIAISRAVNDSGMFELNFRDERYLPFEGTGAVSGWTLEMPPENNRVPGANGSLLESISDVIIHLRYSAKDGGKTVKDGKTFKAYVNGLVAESLIVPSQSTPAPPA